MRLDLSDWFKVLGGPVIAAIALLCFFVWIKQSSDRTLRDFLKLSDEKGCSFDKLSDDLNGALPGGVYSIYTCPDGTTMETYGVVAENLR